MLYATLITKLDKKTIKTWKSGIPVGKVVILLIICLDCTGVSGVRDKVILKYLRYAESKSQDTKDIQTLSTPKLKIHNIQIISEEILI